MKKQKLKLGEVKVKSFVTDMAKDKVQTVKGGGPSDLCISDGGCNWTENCLTFNGYGQCNFHTAQAHNCSEVICYSRFCNSTECNGGASDVCPV